MAQLVNTSMLRPGWSASPCWRCRPEVSSAPVAMALRSRACSALLAGSSRPQQGDVAGGDPVGDAAEALAVLRAEHGAAGDGEAHAGGERTRGQRRLAEAGTGQGEERLGDVTGHGNSFDAPRYRRK